MMNSDFRLFLDIKRELEYKIKELKDSSYSYQYENTINDLKHQNMKLLDQISEKQKDIEEKNIKIKKLINENQIFQNENILLNSEIAKCKSSQEQLLFRFKTMQDNNQKKTLLQRIFKFGNKDN